jgi:hypothetical protein
MAFNNIHILMFNVYMPTDEVGNDVSLDEYDTILNIISQTLSERKYDGIVIGGDLNIDFSRIRSSHLQRLQSFIEAEGLICGIEHPLYQVDFTYESRMTGNKSTLDYFIVSDNMFRCLNDYTCSHDGDNLSDHSLLFTTFDIHIEYFEGVPLEPSEKPSWNKASTGDIEAYKSTLDNLLCNIDIPLKAIECNNLMCQSHGDSIQKFHDAIISACTLASSNCIPKTGMSKHPVVPGWNDHVEHKRQQSLLWNFIWKCNGCPKTGIIADIRRSTRARYHYAIRSIKKDKEKCISKKIAEALTEDNSRNFWDEINKIKRKSKQLPDLVEGAQGTKEIGALFASKYDNLFNSVSYDKEELSEVLIDINDKIELVCATGKCNKCHSVSVEDIHKAIGHLNMVLKD